MNVTTCFHMRAKGLLLVLVCFGVTTFSVFLFGDRQPTLHTIVSGTHKQLSNLKNLKENLRANDKKELVTDSRYLRALGFVDNPRLYPDAIWQNVSLPVVVTALTTEPLDVILTFLNTVYRYLPEHWVILYNLALTESDAEQIEKFCNTSTCLLWKFDFSLFPEHVTDFTTRAYQPLLIQNVLDKVGAIFWLDVTFQLTTSHLEPIFLQALTNGVAAWSDNRPTSALTHPHMFDYFRVQRQNFYFHHMANPSHVVLYNKAEVHAPLILPWLQCALTAECVAPIGSQRSGCRFDKKPFYRYSGCHRYSASAFSIALGLLFNFNDAPYAVSYKVFKHVETNLVGPNGSQFNNGTGHFSSVMSESPL